MAFTRIAKLFSKEDEDKEPTLRDLQQILAYLEELSRLRTQVSLRRKADDLVPFSAKVDLVSEESRQFSVTVMRALPPEVDEKTVLQMTFTMEGMRFRCGVRFKSRGQYLQAVFHAPDAIYHAERRGAMRARFGAREKARVTMLENLFMGIGGSGRLVNLSIGGLCMKLERAINIKEDKQVPINSATFSAGKELMLVRTTDLPNTPMVECSGVVCHGRESSEGVLYGLQFSALGALENRILQTVLARRLPSFARGFPIKRRRHELVDGVEQITGVKIPGGDLELDEPEEDEAALELEVQAATEEPEAEVDPKERALQRLAQLRKKTKHLLLVISDDMDRAILAGTLQVDGFDNVHEARTLVQALDQSKKSIPDLVIVDQQLGPHSGPEIINKLRERGQLGYAPVVMLQGERDIKVLLGAKAENIKHLVAKPVDYDGELKGLLERLLSLR